MTYEEMISDLVKLREHSMMPAVFKPTLNAILGYFAYEDTPKTTGWIPVSERLPIPPTFCLVTTDGSHGDVIDIALYMSDGWHKASEVLAWMPLPEPYREDGEEE